MTRRVYEVDQIGLLFWMGWGWGEERERERERISTQPHTYSCTIQITMYKSQCYCTRLHGDASQLLILPAVKVTQLQIYHEKRV